MTTLAPSPGPSGSPARPRPSFAERHPLILYFTLAYAVSWAIEIPLVAAARGWTGVAPASRLNVPSGILSPLLTSSG